MSGECQSSVSIGEYRVPSQERGWMLWDNVSQTEVGEGRGARVLGASAGGLHHLQAGKSL